MASAVQSALRADYDADVLRPVGGAGAWLIHSRSLDVGKLLHLLRERNDIVYAEPDPAYHTMQSGPLPNDPNFGIEWALNNTGQTIRGATGTPGDDIHAEGAWSVSTGSASIVVGVVDTGIDGSNADMLPNLWQAASPFTLTIGGNQYNCPAGTRGFSAVTNDSYCDSTDVDVTGHGTWVASMIGATGNNASGYVGVNWTTSLLNLRAASASGDGFDGTIYADDAASAVEAGIQIKEALGSQADLRVINLSIGSTPPLSGFSQTMENELIRAGSFGILVVACAGNDSALSADYPAAYELPNELAVGGSSQNDGQTYDSNYGQLVQISAPGQNIYAWSINGGSELGDGTSAATAYVSGAAALVASHCPLDAIGLRATLMGTVDVVPGLSGSNSTSGRLNVDRAINSCTGTPASAVVQVRGQGCAKCYEPPFPPGPRPVAARGLITITVDGQSFSTSYSGSGGTSLSIANGLASRIQGEFYATQVTGSATGATLTITATADGPYTNAYSLSTSMTDTCKDDPPHTECQGSPFGISGNGNFSGGHN